MIFGTRQLAVISAQRDVVSPKIRVWYPRPLKPYPKKL